MKINLLLTGGVGVAIGAAMWVVAPSGSNADVETSEYTPRQKKAAHAAHPQFDIMRDLKQNVHTGQIEKQDYLNAKLAVEAMMADRSTTLQWLDRGPDNIGGRTRAILVDKDNPLKVFAGSVTGGLFVSFDGGNSWSKVQSFTENLSISSMAQTPSGVLYVATGHFEEGSGGNGGSGGFGNGIFRSADNGATWTQVSGTSTITYVNEIVSDSRHPDRIWIATPNTPGIRLVENGTLTTAASWGATGLPNSGFHSLDISPDGVVLVGAAATTGRQTWVSQDGGLTWSNKSGISPGQIPVSGIGRLEYAISKIKNASGFYNIYGSMATNGGAFAGAYMSDDNGSTWYMIAPNTSSQNPDHPGAFTPFSTSAGNQGNYNNIITVHPTDPGKVFLGGIDVYEWNQGTTNPPFGQWEQRSLWYASQFSPVYVHADNHELKWDQIGSLYIGNDGGIGKSPPGQFNGQFFFPANRGYNVTQFYQIAFSKEGWVMGGTQDNGTLFNDGSGLTSQSFYAVRGGDGFHCDISHTNSDIMFASVYTGDMQRSNDRGTTWSPFFSNVLGSISSNAGFYTTGRLWENPNDVNSTDNIIYVPSAITPAGTNLNLISTNSGMTVPYTTTELLCWADTLVATGSVVDTVSVTAFGSGIQYQMSTLNYYVINTDSLYNIDTDDTIVIASMITQLQYFAPSPCDASQTVWIGTAPVVYNFPIDTLFVQDKYQSWYAFGMIGTHGVWITRQALRFNVTPQWYQVVGGTNVNDGSGIARVKTLEFSSDGNHLYVGTWGGEVWRVSNLNSVYVSDPNASGKANVGSPSRTITTTRVFKGNASAAITGIAIDPRNPGHVVVTMGSFGISTHVYESYSADIDPTTATFGSFASIQGNLPDMPVYSAIIDRLNEDQVVVGTEMGVYITNNANGGSTTWHYASGDFGNVPVFDVRQQWRDFSEGTSRPGEIYIGTHGRGIWSSATLLNVNEPITDVKDNKFISSLLIFPNPMVAEGDVSFELKNSGTVSIRIYTLDGREAQRNEIGFLPDGKHQIRFNAAALSAGTYLMEVVSGDSRSIGKFIVKK